MNGFSRFEVGMELVFAKDLDSRAIPYRSKLVGWKPDSYLIVELPVLNATVPHWDSGVGLSAKFTSGTSVFNFHTTLLKSINFPAPLMFLKFPKKIESASTRAFDRIQTHIEAKIHPVMRDPVTPHSAVLLDLSTGGGLFEIESNRHLPAVGSLASISFTLPDGSEVNELLGEIRNIRIGNGAKLLGIKFVEKNPEPVAVLRNFFEEFTNGVQNR